MQHDVLRRCKQSRLGLAVETDLKSLCDDYHREPLEAPFQGGVLRQEIVNVREEIGPARGDGAPLSILDLMLLSCGLWTGEDNPPAL